MVKILKIDFNKKNNDTKCVTNNNIIWILSLNVLIYYLLHQVSKVHKKKKKTVQTTNIPINKRNTD